MRQSRFAGRNSLAQGEAEGGTLGRLVYELRAGFQPATQNLCRPLRDSAFWAIVPTVPLRFIHPSKRNPGVCWGPGHGGLTSVSP